MIQMPINTRPDLVEVSNGAYASMIAPDGSFPGAELIGLADGVRTSPAREVGCDPIGLALRQVWAVWKRLNKPTARSRRDQAQPCTWQALEIGAGRGNLAHYSVVSTPVYSKLALWSRAAFRLLARSLRAM